MASSRAGADPLSPESRRQVLRDGLRNVRTPEFIPYDETPWPLTVTEAVALSGAAVSTLCVTSSRIQAIIARAFGKNHAAEQHKQIMKGMVIIQNAIDESSISTKDLNLNFPKAKIQTPKRKRIPDREPYYVKLTKPRRR